MAFPNTFATSTGARPGADLDENFAALEDSSSASQGDALVASKRTESGAVARTVHGVNQLRPLEPEDFGAVGDGSTNDSTALQAWLDAGAASGGELCLPPKVYAHASTLTITNTGVRGFLLRGSSSGDYGTVSVAPARGSVLKYTGTGTGVSIDGGASPKTLTIKGVTFVGSTSATIGMSVRRATNLWFDEVIWYGYGSSAKALVLNTTASEFVGVIDFTRCVWLKNNIALHGLKGSINDVRFFGGQFGSNTQDIVVGEAGVAMDTRNWSFFGTSFEETTSNCVYSYGGAQNWAFYSPYVEQNDAGNNNPRFYFAANGSSPISAGIAFYGGTFSKQIQASGQRLIKLESVVGFTFSRVWSGYPVAAEGTFTDRYIVEADASCGNLNIELADGVSGAVPYPVLFNSVSYPLGINTQSVDLRGTTVRRNGYDLPSGYLPQNNQSSNYTLALTDLTKHVITGSSAITYTVPPNSSVAFPVGAHIHITNDSGGNITIARGSGVAMVWSSTGADANRTLASRGWARLLKLGADRWFIDGTGLS